MIYAQTVHQLSSVEHASQTLSLSLTSKTITMIRIRVRFRVKRKRQRVHVVPATRSRLQEYDHSAGSQGWMEAEVAWGARQRKGEQERHVFIRDT